MKLKLNKAIVFFDLEATGLDVVNDRIVEISLVKIDVSGDRKSFTSRINPKIPIPPESTAIHGIKDEDVVSAPTFELIGKDVKVFIGNADLAGFNSNRYDIPLLVEEFGRNNIEFDLSKRRFVDVQNIFHKMERRNLETAYRYYCGKELKNAHSAEADVLATIEVLEAQLDTYKELEPTTEFLHVFASFNRNVDLAGRIILNDKDIEVFNFGKYKGQGVLDVFKKDPGYYSWILNADFPRETKSKFTELKLRELNTSE
ncbi:MAG: 3'-5' exonuclease [Vicingaceae bacterium]